MGLHVIHLLLGCLLLATIAHALVCPECKEKRLKSRVYPGGCTSTAAACSSYYDEDGNYVSNKCNRCSCSYSCSQGHHWHDTHAC